MQRTLRVPAYPGPPGDGGPVARQLDAVLVGVGFKASGPLLEQLSTLAPGPAMDVAVTVVGAVRELVGDQVAHNPYFADFPDNVPDTVEFWAARLRAALVGRPSGDGAPTDAELLATVDAGWVDLLALPGYGRPQRSYADMLSAHEQLLPSVKDRFTVLHLGGPPEHEARRLYLELAGSVTPLGPADLALLDELARACLDGEQPAAVPVRENRAVLGAARLGSGRPLLAVDTVTDVLRIVCQASGGDVSLAEPTRFRPLRRPERRRLMDALEGAAGTNPGSLGDVRRYARRWQRLGERLHPHEYPGHPHARDVFAVARGERAVSSLGGRVEAALRSGEVLRAAEGLAVAPGQLLRGLDVLLRRCPPADTPRLLELVHGALGRVSGRVLCSTREHLANRPRPEPARVFVNRASRAWVAPDDRPPLPGELIERVSDLLDEELSARLPAYEHLVVDPAVLDLALPLSGKASGDGFGVLPRGSVMPVEGELLRMFTHWRQSSRRTDFDLSALLLDDRFGYRGHVSWTNYQQDGAYYSGDLTEAPHGATEFIDLPLATVSARYVVAQVNVYSGEGFDEVAESMFGFMSRDLAQKGMPFEASTVRARSAMRGPSRVALPVVFVRGDDGGWSARWLHLYVRGRSLANRVEENRAGAALLVRSIVLRDYLRISYLVDRLRAKARRCTSYAPDSAPDARAPGTGWDGPVTFIGLDRPEDLPDGSREITLGRLSELIPA